MQGCVLAGPSECLLTFNRRAGTVAGLVRDARVSLVTAESRGQDQRVLRLSKPWATKRLRRIQISSEINTKSSSPRKVYRLKLERSVAGWTRWGRVPHERYPVQLDTAALAYAGTFARGLRGLGDRSGKPPEVRRTACTAGVWAPLRIAFATRKSVAAAGASLLR